MEELRQPRGTSIVLAAGLDVKHLRLDAQNHCNCDPKPGCKSGKRLAFLTALRHLVKEN